MAGPTATRGHGAPRSATAKWGKKWGRGSAGNGVWRGANVGAGGCSSRWPDNTVSVNPRALRLAPECPSSRRCRGTIAAMTGQGQLFFAALAVVMAAGCHRNNDASAARLRRRGRRHPGEAGSRRLTPGPTLTRPLPATEAPTPSLLARENATTTSRRCESRLRARRRPSASGVPFARAGVRAEPDVARVMSARYGRRGHRAELQIRDYLRASWPEIDPGRRGARHLRLSHRLNQPQMPAVAGGAAEGQRQVHAGSRRAVGVGVAELAAQSPRHFGPRRAERSGHAHIPVLRHRAPTASVPSATHAHHRPVAAARVRALLSKRAACLGDQIAADA